MKGKTVAAVSLEHFCFKVFLFVYFNTNTIDQKCIVHVLTVMSCNTIFTLCNVRNLDVRFKYYFMFHI